MIKGNGRCLLYLISIFLAALFTSACSQVSAPEITIDPVTLRFSGNEAFALEADFVNRFPNRHSGQPNNELAAAWLQEAFTNLGLSCRIDGWQVINYSQTVPLRNVICELPGNAAQQILLVAHFDQSPDTVFGADNDGSGIAILLNLAQVFAAEPARPYTLVFLASDGEEYGMLGTRRFVQEHPDTSQIIAGLSLDNVGKEFYDGVMMDPRGQFRGFGDLWLQLLAQEAARAQGNPWVPRTYSPLDQVLYQAVPISFMDEGPLVAAGVPAFGFTGSCPAEYSKQCWETYHTPEDLMQYQSADVLHQVGRITEATIRQLFAMQTFPQEAGPYIYLQNSSQVLRGLPLWAIFVAFVGIFFAGVILNARKVWGSEPQGRWRHGLFHFMGLWLPMVGAVLLLYLFVAVGLMDKYEAYPALAKGAELFEPRWPAVILWLGGLTLLFWWGRRVAGRLIGEGPVTSIRGIRFLSWLIIGLGGVYVLLANPFSLLFMIPVPFWFFITSRRGAGKVLDILLFLLGGIVVYVLFYFFGFVILRNDFAVFWYLMMMFSIQLISFKSAMVITAVIAAGLSLVVDPPHKAVSTSVAPAVAM